MFKRVPERPNNLIAAYFLWKTTARTGRVEISSLALHLLVKSCQLTETGNYSG